MSNYNHEHFPFRTYVTNLGAYNEGILRGEWVQFPTDGETIAAVLKRIGIGSYDNCGCRYEEIFISDYDDYADCCDGLGEYESLDALNYLASLLDDMKEWEFDTFSAIMEYDGGRGVAGAITAALNVDAYNLYGGIDDYEDYARMYVDDGCIEIPECLENYIDYESLGRDIVMDSDGGFTSNGFIECVDGVAEWDGAIPDEYELRWDLDGIAADDGESAAEVTA